MSAALASEVFRAVSDPTRRAVLDLLVGGERPAGELAAPFDMSQPAMSQHLRVLREAGLVEQRREGRRQIYKLRPERLREIHEWVRHYEQFWNDKLDALGDYLDNER